MIAGWDSVADVVVVGYGCAGAVTAIAAREEGADVLVIEKQPENSHCTSSAMSGGHLLSPTDEKGVLKYLAALSRIPIGLTWTEDDISRVWARYAVKNKAWLEAHGGKVVKVPGAGEHPMIPGYDTLTRYHFMGNGLGLQRCLDKNIKSNKISVSYNTRAKKLLTDDKGQIIGVEVEIDTDKGEKAVRIGASKGVVLTCGGFEFDERMKLNYLPVHPTYFTGHPSATGDGIRMALRVGADLWHMNCLAARLVVKLPGFPIAFSVSLDGTTVRGRPSVSETEPEKYPGYVIVDRDGKRFTNERFKTHCVYYETTFFDTQRMLYPRVPSYWIFDRRRIELDSLISLRAGAAGPCRLYEWSRDNSDELEKGWIFTASSIAELAGKLNLPPDNLVKTINTYNKYCDKGKDPDFSRSSESLIPLDAPPFFAISLWPGGPNTQGGPRRNSRSQVLNVDGEPIPGLYSAGEMGSIFGMLYPSAGGNLAECIAMGRLAGENVAHERQ
ncbi:FAD-dependent oxidoreductase, partial [Chloroflexota bacterium]